MKISTVMDDTKLIKLGQRDQCCAVGKGGKDVHPNACLAVRVKTIIYLAVLSETRYIKKNNTNTPL